MFSMSFSFTVSTMSTKDPQESTGGDPLAEEPAGYFQDPPVGSVHTSQKINEKGDRLLLPGDPGEIERFTQHRKRKARLQAEDYVRGHLEKHVPEVLEIITDKQLEDLVWVIRSLCQQTANEHRAQFLEVVKRAGDFIPPALAVPDPRDASGNFRNIGPDSGQDDPLPLDCPTQKPAQED